MTRPRPLRGIAARPPDLTLGRLPTARTSNETKAGSARPEALWTHEETAAFLRLPPATLHQLNYKGTGPRSYKVGRYRRYDPADVAAWLASRASDASW